MQPFPPKPDPAQPQPDSPASAAGEPIPGLGERIRAQVRAAGKAGARPEQIEALSAESLEKPLELDEAFAPVVRDPHAIRGYVIERDISAGGQGSVLLAAQEATGRKVAIKILAGGPFITSRHRGRFEREAAVLAKLQHPAIVGILDKGRTADGSLFIVMDYIEGRDLDAHLDSARRDGAAVREVVELFATIAEAVEEAHAQQIVHRDLKPSNIRVDRWGRPHLLDFGLAHLTDPDSSQDHAYRLTATGNVVGSLPWASPEQATGDLQRLGPPSDVYSLGVVMYHALTGRPPYPPGETVHASTQIICKTAPPALELAIRPPFDRVDPRLSRIVLKCMEKHPALRYPTAGALAADLRAWCTGAPTSVDEPKQPWWYWLPYAVAGVLVAIVAVVWYAGRPAPMYPIELPRTRNFIGMEFVKVPPGRSAVATHWQESDADAPQSKVVTFAAGFHIACTEVTQEQYRRVMGQLPDQVIRRSNDVPVDRVSWADAVEFCSRLTQLDGRTHRLPTDEEWEYACRAGTPQRIAGTGKLPEMGWYEGNSNRDLHAVAGKSPNHWGLFDMHGNAAEWCGSEAVLHPMTRPAGDQALLFVVRGGSADSSEASCRSNSRGWAQRDTRRPQLGFRVVLDPAIPPATAPAAAADDKR